MKNLKNLEFIIFNPSAGIPELGPNLRWHWVGSELVTKGYSVKILSASNFHKFSKNIFPPYNKVADGISYFFTPNISYVPGTFCHALHWLIYLFFLPIYFIFFLLSSKHQKRVYIFSSPPIFHFLFIPLLKIFDRHSYFAADFRDLWPNVIIEIRGRSSFLIDFVMSCCENIAIRNVDFIISPKEGDFLYFSEKYKNRFNNSKFLYLPNGRLVSNVPINPPILEASIHPKINICYVGSFGDYYDIMKVLSLFKEISYHGYSNFFHFSFAGDGKDLSKIKEGVVLYPDISVEFFGRLSKSDADSIIKFSDVCYLPLKNIPSNKYGISCNKIYDYMSFSKPIIGHYNASTYDPVLVSGCGNCVNDGLENKLVEFLIKFYYNRKLLSCYGSKGFSYLMENCSPDINSLRLISFISRL